MCRLGFCSAENEQGYWQPVTCHTSPRNVRLTADSSYRTSPVRTVRRSVDF